MEKKVEVGDEFIWYRNDWTTSLGIGRVVDVWEGLAGNQEWTMEFPKDLTPEGLQKQREPFYTSEIGKSIRKATKLDKALL